MLAHGEPADLKAYRQKQELVRRNSREGPNSVELGASAESERATRKEQSAVSGALVQDRSALLQRKKELLSSLAEVERLLSGD